MILHTSTVVMQIEFLNDQFIKNNKLIQYVTDNILDQRCVINAYLEYEIEQKPFLYKIYNFDAG